MRQLTLVLIATVIAALKDLFPASVKKWVSVASIVVAFIGFGLALADLREKERENELLRARAPVFVDAELRNVKELSGGTTVRNQAYLVSDEEAVLHEFLLDDAGANPRFRYQRSIPLRNQSGGLDKTGVDDLEGVASNPRNPDELFLVTSHSASKNGNERLGRQRVLRVSIGSNSPGLVTGCTNLRPAIQAALFDTGLMDGELKQTQIEGLGSDGEHLFFGLRAPLTRKRESVILRVKIAGLFVDDPSECKPVDSHVLSVFPVSLSIDGVTPYGISSIEFDKKSGDLFILPADPKEFDLAPSAICRWSPTRALRFSECRKSQELARPASGKQEVLLLPEDSNSVFVFYDADDRGTGAQVRYQRPPG